MELELKHVEYYLPDLKVMDCDSEDVQVVIRHFELDNGINFKLTNGLCHISNLILLIDPNNDPFGLIDACLAIDLNKLKNKSKQLTELKS